jgi:hypothetical protein
MITSLIVSSQLQGKVQLSLSFLPTPSQSLTLLISTEQRFTSMAHVQYSRQVGVCPEGTAFYKCAVGPFTGCCSTNPCDTGVCEDVEPCDPSLPSKSQDLSPTMPEEKTTTLTVTVSEMITSLVVTVTISDVITSFITGSAAATTSQEVTSLPTWDSLIPDMTASPYSVETPPTSSHFSIGSTLSETSVSSIRGTDTIATIAIANSSKTSSLWMTQTSSAIPPSSKGQHTSTVVGGIMGGLSLLAFLALLALLLLSCCCRRRSKYSFSVKSKSKEEEEEKERAKLLRRAEETALERRLFPSAAITTGAQSPVETGRTADAGPSAYPRNSTAIPPQRWA